MFLTFLFDLLPPSADLIIFLLLLSGGEFGAADGLGFFGVVLHIAICNVICYIFSIIVCICIGRCFW